jgi:two-component system, NtrC family, nitrogen regulation sensor histidine kinase NtrY
MATINDVVDDISKAPARHRLSPLLSWTHNEKFVQYLEIFSVTGFVVIGIATGVFLTGLAGTEDPLAPSVAATLLVMNLLPATTLLVLFGRRLAMRRALKVHIGSKELLHVRLVAIFSLIAAVPTLLLVIFASLLFQSGVQFWFSNSARGMLENASALATGYNDDKTRDIRDETTTMAGDFRFALNQTKPDNPAFLDYYFKQVLARKLSESAIISIGPDKRQSTTAVVSPDDKRKDEWIDSGQLKRLENGEGLVVSIKPDRIEAISVLFDNPRSYLYTNKTTTVPSFELGKKAQSVLRDYDAMVARSRSLQVRFNIALYLVSLLIIGITVWVALLVADRLVRPVTKLVEAAQRIADGDLSVRVSENGARQDEVGFLSQSFNRMTERLQSQTSNLLGVNRQLDERRTFIEAVLESVSAGIISVDKNNEIGLANSTAEKLLGHEGVSIIGQKLNAVSETLDDLTRQPMRQSVAQLGEGPDPLTVSVKVSERGDSFVITFEDISQQLADQRRAAWSDVARRIAHEIKNPLTPIQLAAERLQRRFGKTIGEGAAIFEQLTGTIVRQVGDLRNIVDEFSSFARMPKPVLRQESLIDIVGHSIFLYEVAHTDIAFTFAPPDNVPPLICDRRQLGQAITNILKNAAESIHEQATRLDDPDYKGRINATIRLEGDSIIAQFRDNGTGLPKDRERIVEPYVTTRATGSGLGLAIVKKIIEEHFAEISFDDAEGGGAIVTMRFEPEILAMKTQTARIGTHENA